jgi:hypothetical protein
MTVIWANSYGFGIAIFWFAVYLILGARISEHMQLGYFLAMTYAASDLAFRFFRTRPVIQGLGVERKVNGKTNADALWLVSGLGPTFFSIPGWIGAAMIAAGTFALDNYVR